MRLFPPVSFHSVTIHHSYIEAHLTLLEGHDNAVLVHGDGYKKAVVTAVADEQPLSQTTFKFSDCSGQFLLGLEKPFSAGVYGWDGFGWLVGSGQTGRGWSRSGGGGWS